MTTQLLRQGWRVLSVASLIGLSTACQPDAETFDLVIRGGSVADGTGAPLVDADVGIRDGRIAAVGDLEGAVADELIDATDRVVSPGFIDMHTHSEYALLRDGRGLSKTHQGVTLEVLGEGSSPGPRRDGMEAGRGNWGVTPDWTTLGEYFQKLEEQGVSVNVASYVAARQLRRYVYGEEHRRPTAEELEQMKELLAEGMEQGALGLVAALEEVGQDPSDAVPGTEELIELAKVVAGYGGIYASHIRNQSDGLVASIEEAARIGEEGGVGVEIFHLKAAGRPYFGEMRDALDAIQAARDRGVDIAADIYPYIAAAHGLSTEIPRWAHAGGHARLLERLADPELRGRIKQEMTDYMTWKYYNELEGVGAFDAVMVTSTLYEPERYVGKTLGAIARERGDSDPADTALDLMVEQDGQVGLVMFYMSEEDVTLGIQSPLTTISSDGTAIDPDWEGQPHPRYFGTFPRVLGHYVREKGALPLEEAIAKMTSHAAAKLGIEDRGRIAQGMWADIVVFDPERIIDRATFGDSKQYPEGIDYVLVNGVMVIEEGDHTGATPGRVVYGPGKNAGSTPAAASAGQ
jgi:N-acyl-D-amino-acid deacylase